MEDCQETSDRRQCSFESILERSIDAVGRETIVSFVHFQFQMPVDGSDHLLSVGQRTIVTQISMALKQLNLLDDGCHRPVERRLRTQFVEQFIERFEYLNTR